MKGLVHIYTGDGKGKTTAAIGLGIRACGHGKRVLMVQFLKSSPTGETAALERLMPCFEVRRGTASTKFTWDMNDDEKNAAKLEQKALLEYAAGEMKNGRRDIVILDEIMAAIGHGMVTEDEAASFIESRPESVELVLTGRKAPQRLIGLADYCSEIKSVKHPMEKGIPPRKGIEF